MTRVISNIFRGRFRVFAVGWNALKVAKSVPLAAVQGTGLPGRRRMRGKGSSDGLPPVPAGRPTPGRDSPGGRCRVKLDRLVAFNSHKSGPRPPPAAYRKTTAIVDRAERRAPAADNHHA